MFAAFFIVNGSLLATNEACELDVPVKVNFAKVVENSPFHTHLLGKDIISDKFPIFWDPEKYSSEEDKLELRLFNITWNDKLTGHLGVHISIAGSFAGVGFSNYTGNYSFTFSESDKNGLTTPRKCPMNMSLPGTTKVFYLSEAELSLLTQIDIY